MRLMMRVLGFVLAVWASFLLTRDVVLSGTVAVWFVAATGSLGMFAFISSWWPPKPSRRQTAATEARWAKATR